MTEREREVSGPTGQRFSSRQVKRWQAEFPYHWDADDLVSRRQLLKFTVYTSGALFFSTVIVAFLSLLRRPVQPAATPIARVSDLPEGQALYFKYPGPDDEAMLLHLPGGSFVAYSQKCTHLSCSVFYQADQGRLYCPCHEGVFNPLTGDPEAGPPARRLPRIALRQEGDTVYAVDRVP